MSRRIVQDAPGRPREFDRDEVLARATQVFWDKGFAKTTYAELEKATGLHRQSLVYAFGGKQALFQEVLNYYAKTRVQTTLDQLQAPGPALENIRIVFAGWLDDARREAATGCLMVNTSGELGSAEQAIAGLIEESNQRLVTAFQSAFAMGQAQGEIVATIDAADLACHAMAIGDGALLRSRATGDATLAQAAFRSFLMMISIA